MTIEPVLLDPIRLPVDMELIEEPVFDADEELELEEVSTDLPAAEHASVKAVMAASVLAPQRLLMASSTSEDLSPQMLSMSDGLGWVLQSGSTSFDLACALQGNNILDSTQQACRRGGSAGEAGRDGQLRH